MRQRLTSFLCGVFVTLALVAGTNVLAASFSITVPNGVATEMVAAIESQVPRLPGETNAQLVERAVRTQYLVPTVRVYRHRQAQLTVVDPTPTELGGS